MGLNGKRTTKGPLSSPVNKDGKKAKGDKPDECVVCTEATTSDASECSWSEGIQHVSCTKLSKEQCNAIKDITSPNIVFFYTTCLRGGTLGLVGYLAMHSRWLESPELQIKSAF